MHVLVCAQRDLVVCVVLNYLLAALGDHTVMVTLNRPSHGGGGATFGGIDLNTAVWSPALQAAAAMIATEQWLKRERLMHDLGVYRTEPNDMAFITMVENMAPRE